MPLFSPNPDPPRTRFPSPGVAFSLLSESASHRAELAALEMSEARDHVLVSLLLAAGTAAIALIAGFAITLLLASLAWDSPHRAWWLVGICTAYVGTATGLGFMLVRRMRDWRPLESTQTQLQEDLQCLNKLIKSAAL